MKRRVWRNWVFICVFMSLALGITACGNTAGTPEESAKQPLLNAEENPSSEQNSDSLPREIIIGSDKAGGAASTMANGLASIITEATGIKTTVKSLGTIGSYMDQFEAGDIDFSLTSKTDPIWAYYGEKDYEGQKREKLRTVMIGTNQGWSLLLDAEGVTSPEELAAWLPGKSVTYHWFNPVIDLYMDVAAANLGISPADWRAVPVGSYDDMAASWSEHKIDAAAITLGAGIYQQMMAARPFHVGSLSNSPEAIERMNKIEPALYISKQEPGPLGVEEPIHVLTYDYWLGVRDDVDDEVVRLVLKALYENQDKIAKLPNLEEWGPAEGKWVSDTAFVPYHSAAVDFYKEIGLWNETMEQKQAEWLSGKPRF